MVNKTICDVGCLMSSTSMALNGTGITITTGPDAIWTDPGSLNHWLQDNGGYDSGNDFIEEVLPSLRPNRVVWPADAMHKTNDLPYATIAAYLEKGRIVLANVCRGHHFVLVVGYSDDGDSLAVHDPGFDRSDYSYKYDVVGWRIFDFARSHI